MLGEGAGQAVKFSYKIVIGTWAHGLGFRLSVLSLVGSIVLVELRLHSLKPISDLLLGHVCYVH